MTTFCKATGPPVDVPIATISTPWPLLEEPAALELMDVVGEVGVLAKGRRVAASLALVSALPDVLAERKLLALKR